jgi:hypothetical protein
MLRKNEFLEEKRTFNYIDATGNDSSVQIHEGQLVFTFCQVPVIYSISNEYKTVASLNDGTEMSFNQLGLDDTISKEVFKRSRKVEYITVHIKDEYLK